MVPSINVAATKQRLNVHFSVTVCIFSFRAAVMTYVIKVISRLLGLLSHDHTS